MIGRWWMLLCFAAGGVSGGAVVPAAAQPGPWANRSDEARAPDLERRAADWRNGAIIYQVLVDRFAPPANLDAKRQLYPAPKRLRPWDETPAKGEYLADVNVWQHEIDFWGGDLASLRSRLDYVHDLGADVLYLNPIHQAYTNHKYDAQDYFAVSAEYGTRDDVKALAADCHGRDMRLMLDGVFNHVGRSSKWFQEALADPNSPYRDWFFFSDQYKFGYRAWANVENLPELRHENPQLRARLYNDPDSVVQGYLRDGVDGWRLDVAFDLGFVYLQELTNGAHTAKPGSLVVGEIWNYPEEWSPSVDAVMNFYYRELFLHLLRGHTSGVQAGRMIDRMIADAGLEPILKSWVVLDNHDTERLAHMLPEPWQRRFAETLQFTVPGSPNLYYGTELGMAGGGDPENRAPMRWDLVNDDNADLAFVRRLVALRRESRALRIGDWRLLDSTQLLAFERYTDRVEECRIILANVSDAPVTEVLPIRDSKLMNWTQLADMLSDYRVQVVCGMIHATVPARTVVVLRPDIERGPEYSAYKRIQ